ncbi:hypothetical protein PVAP13_3KG114827, partial [Panicum virgatum]
EASCHLPPQPSRIPFEPPLPCLLSSDSTCSRTRQRATAVPTSSPPPLPPVGRPAGRTDGARPTTSSARRPSAAAAAASGRFRAAPGLREFRGRACSADRSVTVRVTGTRGIGGQAAWLVGCVSALRPPHADSDSRQQKKRKDPPRRGFRGRRRYS